MIQYEDADFEEFFFAEQPDVAIPLEVKMDVDGNLTVTTYRKTENIAKEYEARFREDPFSSEALRFLDQAIRPLVISWGYRPDKRCESHILNFEAKSADQIKSVDGMSAGEIIFELPAGVGNQTTYDFEESSGDPVSVIIRDGAVVSLACINPYDDFSDERELNTETAPAYRRQGLSAANTATLAKLLLSNGYRVTYNCNTKNIASRRVAEKCGFTFIGRSYYYVCYREE